MWMQGWARYFEIVSSIPILDTLENCIWDTDTRYRCKTNLRYRYWILYFRYLDTSLKPHPKYFKMGVFYCFRLINKGISWILVFVILRLFFKRLHKRTNLRKNIAAKRAARYKDTRYFKSTESTKPKRSIYNWVLVSARFFSETRTMWC